MPDDSTRPARPRKALAEDGNRSLQRGLAVLDAVSRHREPGLRVAELMRLCGLERAPVYRLLATLVAEGYVVQRERFRYVPGPRVDRLAGLPADDLVARLQPVLARVSERTQDAAFAVVREGLLSHCIARHIGGFPVQVLTVQVGRRQPLGVGAAGLALLASFPVAQADAIVAGNAPLLGRYGGMTPERLQLLLRATRERGWSVVGNHAAADTLGVGIAVPSSTGAPRAAISVAAPLQRMPRQRQGQVARAMREALAALLPEGL